MKSKQIILITGASSGIGKATAQQLLKKGNIVYCASRNIEKMRDLESLGGHILEMDVTVKTSIQKGVASIISQHGQIDVLFANAGYGLFGAIEDVSSEDILAQYETNVFGLGKTIQAVLPYMREKKSGKIILTSSAAGKISGIGMGWYCSTKHAVEAIADALRLEVRPFNIKVVKIRPGFVNTGFQKIAIPSLKKTLENSVYAKSMKMLTDFVEKNNQKAPKANEAAKVVVEAVEAYNPKTSYQFGIDAKAGLFMKRFFSEKVMDNLYRRMLKL